MTVLRSAVAAVALVFAIGASGAMAKEAKVATDAKVATAKVHTPESIECSKQADAKGLHGDARKKFRSECKKEMEGKSHAMKKPDVKPDAKMPDKKS